MKTATNDPSHVLESNVRSYVRSFPILVDKAKGSYIYTKDGDKYLDFLAGAGTLNYGHNNSLIKKHLIEYLESDRIIHGLDMATTAKDEFIEAFNSIILKPRGLDYKLQFCGPTGTNAVEAALKLAKKITGRTNVISFTNGYHGMTMGALSVTGNQYHKDGIPGSSSNFATFMPYCNYSDAIVDSIDFLRQHLADNSSGVNVPAAIILENVQGEGGINIASIEWLRSIRNICDEYGILLILDDIQMGCGRTGSFFSFENSGVVPDIVTLSKSISGYGLPMALVLMKPEHDQWEPGQHNGTFRGHNLAFYSATKTLELFWKNQDFSKAIGFKSGILKSKLEEIAARHPELKLEVRGRGLAYGIESKEWPEFAGKVQAECFKHKLIIEVCGATDQVLKFLPPLTITQEELEKGINIVSEAADKVAAEYKSAELKKEA